jgi:hypothetical protein
MGKNAKDHHAGKVRQISQPESFPVRRGGRWRRPRLTGVGAQEAKAQVKWDLSTDVVIIGAGVAGLLPPLARDHGASVIIVVKL